jgi:hypothetical protein
MITEWNSSGLIETGLPWRRIDYVEETSLSGTMPPYSRWAGLNMKTEREVELVWPLCEVSNRFDAEWLNVWMLLTKLHDAVDDVKQYIERYGAPPLDVIIDITSGDSKELSRKCEELNRKL